MKTPDVSAGREVAAMEGASGRTVAADGVGEEPDAATVPSSGVVARSSAGPATAPSPLSELCSTASNESEVKR